MKLLGKMSNRKHRPKTLYLITLVFVVGIAAALLGCSSSDDNNAAASPGNTQPPGQTPQNPPAPTTTAIPTPPAGLPALVRDAGGPSNGFNVTNSPGMIQPAVAISPVPQATGGTIVDMDAAIRLGKALFWDAQVGSDGQQACASCHFHAGADNRTIDTVHPGPDALFDPTLVVPLTFDPSVIDDVVGSGGVFSMAFTSVPTDPLDPPVDACLDAVPGDASEAAIHALGQRLVTGRNTPPAVGAVYFLDNFWDGRASHDFNGLDPSGSGTAVSGLSSLASQSTGPPLSDVEMSCAGRTWNGPNGIGAKLVLRMPLANQLVDPDDSVLGALSASPDNGLECGFGDRDCTYADLIAAAFGTNGLTGQDVLDFYTDNFSSIWGQAVQAYEATLVPNRTPYDLGTLTTNQVNGLNEMRLAGCMICHVEPEFSDATVRAIEANGGTATPNNQGGDQGFHNIGSSLEANDAGRDASPGGTYQTSALNIGAFKTAALRNVKLTAPYMHNGSIASLREVVDFYNGTNQIVTNPGFDPDASAGIGGGGAGGPRDQATDFLTNGLTDCRVEHELAPFDHPALEVPNGPSLPATGATGDGTACP